MKGNNILFLIALFLCVSVVAQNKQFIDVITSSNQSNFISYKSNSSITTKNLIEWYGTDIGLSNNDQLKLYKKEKDLYGFTHYRYKQYNNGVEVSGAQYLIHEKNQRVVSSNGKIVRDITATNIPAITPSISIQKAINFIDAQQYMWESEEQQQLLKYIKGDVNASYYPKTELVYFDKYFTQVGANYKLVYRIEIHAQQPLVRKDVFVDAQTGKIVHTIDNIHTTEVDGVAFTKYSGTRTIKTDSVSSTQYRLRETSRGGGIETYNMLQGTVYDSAVDFIDSNNIWNNINAQKDEVATDAHFATEMSYDYFMLKHGRDSYDNAGAKLISYVHYGEDYSNAFWNGTYMTYGDGDGLTYTPLSTLDIGGHEVTHGVTEFSAGLIYQDEYGALNESFSDIFGTAIEFFADSANGDWFIGEDADIFGNGFRNMADPKSDFSPDTYLGVNWVSGTTIDHGGVHTNSGVQNYWFYLLSVGGAGTNDNGNAYSVVGLGIDTGVAIAYRNLTVYLTPTSEYNDARVGAIQSAIDLYGACSNAVVQTSRAWEAVGVGYGIENSDLQLVTVDAPTTSCALTVTENVTIILRNNGCLLSLNIGDKIPVGYRVDSGAVVNDTITLAATLVGGDSLSFTFTASADFSVIGIHTIDAWLDFGLDPKSFNDSLLGVQVENKIQQNTDVSLTTIRYPVSGCSLSSTDSVEIGIQFLGCDSLPIGTNIDVAYQLNGGAIVNETMVLPTTIYAEDIIFYAFSNKVDLSASGTYTLKTWTKFLGDTLNANDTIVNSTIQHPYPLYDRDVVTFEDSVNVLDTFYTVTNSQTKILVSGNIFGLDGYGLQITGGDPIGSGIMPDTDTSHFWTKNKDYAAETKFCVDATGWLTANLRFDLRQTYSSFYRINWGEILPKVSSLRIVVNGLQIGKNYHPTTENNDVFTVQHLNLDSFAGTQFEVIFETRTVFEQLKDPYAFLGSEGDNVFIDNIMFSEASTVGVEKQDKQERVNLYPNPSDGNFRIQFNATQNQSIMIDVFDVLGNKVLSKNRQVGVGSNQFNMSIAEKTAGIYFVRIVSNNQTTTLQLIKN